jgi:cyclopropane fatty-acyl-phospholipid synthase-like methyltransferase
MSESAEMVDGTWFLYFNKIADPILNDETCQYYESLLDKMYGDFFERNLSTEDPLLSLGAGFGLTEIPLARKGYKIIGIDNDMQVLEALKINSQKYGEGNIEVRFGDLYSDFHKYFRDIQACVSFGVLEHFTRDDLEDIIRKQFEISDKIIAMMPINTPATLKTYHAENNPTDNIDENGIYRNFWSADYWENDIFRDYKIYDRCFPSNYANIGQIDMVTYLVKKD